MLFRSGVASLYEYETKGEEPRPLNIKGLALTLLKEMYGDGRDADATVFGNAVNPTFDYQDSWTAAKTAAKITNFRFHDLRHSAASYLLMNGASLGEIAIVLGHKTLQTTKRYAHLSDNHAGGVVERMNDKIFQVSPDASKPQ